MKCFKIEAEMECNVEKDIVIYYVLLLKAIHGIQKKMNIYLKLYQQMA